MALSPSAPEIAARRGSEGLCFGRDDRRSGFFELEEARPAGPTSSAAFAALRGSEGRLLGAGGGISRGELALRIRNPRHPGQ